MIDRSQQLLRGGCSCGEIRYLVICPISGKRPIAKPKETLHLDVGIRHSKRTERSLDAQSCLGLAGDIGTSTRVFTEGCSGRRMGRVRASLPGVRSFLQHFFEYRNHQATCREAVRLVPRVARLAGAHGGLSERCRGAVCGGGGKGACRCTSDRRRDRHCRDGLLNRYCDPESGGPGEQTVTTVSISA